MGHREWGFLKIPYEKKATSKMIWVGNGGFLATRSFLCAYIYIHKIMGDIYIYISHDLILYSEENEQNLEEFDSSSGGMGIGIPSGKLT